MLGYKMEKMGYRNIGYRSPVTIIYHFQLLSSHIVSFVRFVYTCFMFLL